MKIDPQNYQLMRSWFAVMAPLAFPGAPPETDPVKILDETFAKSPSNARKGLAMAVGDLVEATSNWGDQTVAELDKALSADRLPTLSEIRMSFSKEIRRVISRGRIKNEVEYYAVRNAVEQSGGEEDLLWKMLSAYEDELSN